MNKKAERYLNFIIDSLLKGTEYDEEGDVINVPFPHMKNSRKVYWLQSKVSRYIKEKYGANEEEIGFILASYHRANKKMKDKYYK
jgi:hypothetical protein